MIRLSLVRRTRLVLILVVPAGVAMVDQNYIPGTNWTGSYAQARVFLESNCRQVWDELFANLPGYGPYNSRSDEYSQCFGGGTLLWALIGHPIHEARVFRLPPRSWKLVGMNAIMARDTGATFLVEYVPHVYDLGACAVVLADAIRTDVPDVVTCAAARLVASGLVSPAEVV